jgi:hypothetical protein
MGSGTLVVSSCRPSALGMSAPISRSRTWLGRDTTCLTRLTRPWWRHAAGMQALVTSPG